MTAKKHLKMTNPGEVRRAMTVSQYNTAGGMAVMPIWKNPEVLNLRATRQLLAAVPSAVK